MDSASPTAFWELARRVVAEAGRHGLRAPGLRSPPRLRGATRTIRRYPGGHCLVSVQSRGRPVNDVLVDMVEGVLLANGLGGRAADACRARIMAGLLGPEAEAA